MSSTQVQRETTTADYLNNLRREQDATNAGNKAQTNWTPNYILGLLDIVNVSDVLNDTVAGTPGTYLITGDISYQNLYLCFNKDLLDDSGNNNNCTVNGAETYGSSSLTQLSVIDSSFSFDGSTYITAPSGASISGTGNRSLSLLVYPVSFTDGLRIFEYGVAGTRTLFSLQYSGTLGLIKFYDGTNTQTSTTKLNLKQWNWVCVTIGSVGTAFNLYINSTTADTTAVITALNTTASTIFIGSDVSNGNKLVANTLLDELQFFNFVLSSSERTSLLARQQISHNPSVTIPALVNLADVVA